MEVSSEELEGWSVPFPSAIELTSLLFGSVVVEEELW
jgi:hypothetical protein